jgi:hypothetical protein
MILQRHFQIHIHVCGLSKTIEVPWRLRPPLRFPGSSTPHPVMSLCSPHRGVDRRSPFLSHVAFCIARWCDQYQLGRRGRGYASDEDRSFIMLSGFSFVIGQIPVKILPPRDAVSLFGTLCFALRYAARKRIICADGK